MNTPSTNARGPLLIWILVAALFVLHQDFWWWDDTSLVMDFMPIGLFYHAAFSIAAGLLWALANKLAWPEHIEAWAAETAENVVEEGGKQ
jgi:hypothetical protein